MNIMIPVSGGIDSGYLLAHALYANYDVIPIIFDDKIPCKEMEAAYNLCKYYSIIPTILDIPNLNLLRVTYDITNSSNSQQKAMENVDYFSGYKFLMYSTTLSYAGALGNVDEIWWGINAWNDHFIDELKSTADEFNLFWRKSYPELNIPKFAYPIYDLQKYEVLLKADEIGFPFHLCWSCFNDEVTTPCGVCLGCLSLREAMEKAIAEKNHAK
jgi:Predicted PP-loop superfamily ATPase